MDIINIIPVKQQGAFPLKGGLNALDGKKELRALNMEAKPADVLMA
jgi:hypothetical protein